MIRIKLNSQGLVYIHLFNKMLELFPRHRHCLKVLVEGDEYWLEIASKPTLKLENRATPPSGSVNRITREEVISVLTREGYYATS